MWNHLDGSGQVEWKYLDGFNGFFVRFNAITLQEDIKVDVAAFIWN